MKTRIWIDNGHGVNTPGKCSPDALQGLTESPHYLREYEWCREVAAGLVDMLQVNGYDAALLVPELHDVSIKNRALRVNRTCTERGAENVLCVSIHVNAAASDGRWHDANYWCAIVYRQEFRDSNGKVIRVKEASSESKRLATLLARNAGENGWRVSGTPYVSMNLGILRQTQCAAVLTENFFQDNKKGVEYIRSAEGKTAIILAHFNAIVQYLRERGKE